MTEPTNPVEQFWREGHGTWLVPVHVDTDGTVLIPCPYYDGDGTLLLVDWWAAFCGTCRAVVSGPVPGTIGVQDIDSLGDAEWEALQPWETVCEAQHAADLLVRESREAMGLPMTPLCPHRALEAEIREGLALVE